MVDDRTAHRAAVEAGYASLQGYIEKWENENDRDVDLVGSRRVFGTLSMDGVRMIVFILTAALVALLSFVLKV